MTSLTDIANKIVDRNNKETIDGHTKHWWQHEINNARADGYKRGYASGKKVMRDAAVKVVYRFINGDGLAEPFMSDIAEAIAAIPVSEVAPDNRVAKTVFTLEDVQKASDMGRTAGALEMRDAAIKLVDDTPFTNWFRGDLKRVLAALPILGEEK